jgi:hypothetical protein
MHRRASKLLPGREGELRVNRTSCSWEEAALL